MKKLGFADVALIGLTASHVSAAGGTHLGRTLRLLSESTAERAHPVRILFYGQSITKQDWWHDVVADLRKRYPDADIVAENRAIGGFSARRLIHTTERDLVTFYPDLVIFHVYGDHRRYEDIIRQIRSRSTAEIAIQNDHYSASMDPHKDDDGWAAFVNQGFLPAIAEAYACHLIDLRSAWRRHLLADNLAPKALLSDNAHLNGDGCRLMGKLVARGLLHDPHPDAPANRWVKTCAVGQDVAWKEGRLALEFTGNRAVAVLEPGTGKAKVLIDGKPPSAHGPCYAFTRANEGPEVDWPWTVCVPFRISREAPLVAEDWTITVTEGDAARFAFTAKGSKTGPDGGGNSDERFVSESRRIVIEPEHWWREPPGDSPNLITSGYAMRFRSILLGTDELIAGQGTDIVLASDLPNGQHRLELIADGAPPPVVAILTHCPPLAQQGAPWPPLSGKLTPQTWQKPDD